MIDFEDFAKQGKDMIKTLENMQNSLDKNMQQISSMPEAKPVMDKIDILHSHMKAGNLQGVMAIQKELLEMKEKMEQDERKDNSNR